jgi:hypothetical protein
MSNDQPPNTWSEWVATGVRVARKSRGWTIKQLAARCAQIGAPELTAGALYVLEGPRRRNISGDEWLALAEALEVPPLTLMLPPEDTDYPVTSQVTARASAVATWILGMGPLRVPDPDNPGGFLPRHPGEHAARKHRYRTAWVESLPYLPAPTPLHPLDDDEILALVHGLTRLDSEGARRLERALLVANEVQLPLGEGEGSRAGEYSETP